MFTLLTMVMTVAPLDVTGCKATKADSGSLHANTSFEVTLTAPKSKAKQPLDCGGKLVTLFVSDFGDAAGASDAANVVGPQLWGGTAPTAEHTDELLLKAALLVVVSGPAVALASGALEKKGFTRWRGGATVDKSDVITRIARELDCKPASKDPLRPWCVAVLTEGAGFTAPKDVVLLGLSAPLPWSTSITDALLKGTRVSAMAFKGGKVKLTDVTPDNDDEKKQLLEIAMQVAAVLKGNGKAITVSKGMSEFLPVLAEGAGKAGAVLKVNAKGPATTRFTWPVRAWTVKSGALTVYVVAEDTSDGAWLSVYPVAPLTN
ncbi:MAG: hypothetical protein JNM17_14180 [Archangium sp.]|nr:hypothetical protein [Archangium sp.]